MYEGLVQMPIMMEPELAMQHHLLQAGPLIAHGPPPAFMGPAGSVPHTPRGPTGAEDDQVRDIERLRQHLLETERNTMALKDQLHRANKEIQRLHEMHVRVAIATAAAPAPGGGTAALKECGGEDRTPSTPKGPHRGSPNSSTAGSVTRDPVDSTTDLQTRTTGTRPSRLNPVEMQVPQLQVVEQAVKIEPPPTVATDPRAPLPVQPQVLGYTAPLAHLQPYAIMQFSPSKYSPIRDPIAQAVKLVPQDGIDVLPFDAEAVQKASLAPWSMPSVSSYASSTFDSPTFSQEAQLQMQRPGPLYPGSGPQMNVPTHESPQRPFPGASPALGPGVRSPSPLVYHPGGAPPPGLPLQAQHTPR